MNVKVTTAFDLHSVHHGTAPVYHPSSVGMVERAVQLVASMLRKTCYSRPGSINQWSLVLREVMPSLNTRLIRVRGYTPTELLLGFNPSTKHYNISIAHLATREDWESTDPVPDHLLRLHDMYRGERRQNGVEAIALANAFAVEREKRKSNTHREKFQDMDLVLIRDFIRDKEGTGKMKPRWIGPVVLERLNPGGRTAMVRKVYASGSHRVHLDDLRLFYQRSSDH